MAMVQLSGRISLRDIVGNVSAQAHRPSLSSCSAKLTRSNLARMNESKSYWWRDWKTSFRSLPALRRC
ncbi:MAG TPA: hypothetical protein DEF07_07520 [Nitrosomonas sp.]|nr:hypothetical protein [Nitrosomonas sp.]